jgi:hypothetical protein
VTAIAGYAFANCTSLKEVCFSKILNFANYAFENCSSLSRIYFGSKVSITASILPERTDWYLIGDTPTNIDGVWPSSITFHVRSSMYAEQVRNMAKHRTWYRIVIDDTFEDIEAEALNG